MKLREYAPPEFIEKISAKMVVDHLGVTQLARELNVSHPTVVDLVTHGKRPSFDTTIALAEWLNQSPILTLREAGLLPPGNDEEINWEDWKYLISQMTPEEEKNMKQMISITIESRQKSERAARAKNFKPSKVK